MSGDTGRGMPPLAAQERIEALARELSADLGPAAVRRDEPLAAYTVWRIGGPADLAVIADGAETLRQAVMLAWKWEVPCRVLGGGSNVLISDAGVDGLVVANRVGSIEFDGSRAWAESGATFAALARQCAERGLAGLEWAAGIPGTVGGAVVGNAGAWGGDVASVLRQATILEPSGEVSAWPVKRLAYGYRSSALKQPGAGDAGGNPQAIVLAAEFSLKRSEAQAVKARLAEIAARRRASQPPGASCGSVFKNPPSDYAGRLIEAAGLKGHQIGSARISPVHANFFLNVGQATAADVKGLITLAREKVRSQFGIELDLEIELVGRDG